MVPRQEVSLYGVISCSSVEQLVPKRESDHERLALFKCDRCLSPCRVCWPYGTWHLWFLESVYQSSEACPSVMCDSALQSDRPTQGRSGCSLSPGVSPTHDTVAKASG